MAIARLRQRLPFVVFVLLLVFGLLLLGFACACITDHPVQVIERILAAIPALPPVIEIWSVQVALFGMVALALVRPIPNARPSPAALQRFLL
ncbi:MAG: hypothetical protein M3P42_01800 [Actinomycetota bacterium]|nr:hypothetical protein [Actinomycetota bacterium]